jgi:conserved oligomeric Golgi complex subunit 5
VDPILVAIRREVAAIVAKLHRQDLSDNVDPMNAMGGGASPYMKELTEKLTFIKTGVLGLFDIPELSRDWYVMAILSYLPSAQLLPG